MRQWYFRIQQVECEQFNDQESNEYLVFQSIKSFSGNGTREVTLSARDIASRIPISYSTVSRSLPNLLASKPHMIQMVGIAPHNGGPVNTYKVLLLETAKSKRVLQGATASVADSNSLPIKGVADRHKGVADEHKGVATVGVSPIHPNNLKPNSEHISKESLKEISLTVGVEYKDTKRTYERLKDYCASTGKTYKDYTATLRNWIRRDIDSGNITPLTQEEIEDLKVLHAPPPPGAARFIKDGL